MDNERRLQLAMFWLQRYMTLFLDTREAMWLRMATRAWLDIVRLSVLLGR